MIAKPFNAGAAAAGTTAGPTLSPYESPTSAGLVDQASYMNAPTITPQAWGLSSTTGQVDSEGLPISLNSSLYVSSLPPTTHVSGLKRNQILGQMADKLGIKTQKGQSLEEQIIAALAKQYKVSTTTAGEAATPPGALGPAALGQEVPGVQTKGKKAKAGTKKSDQQVLSEVLTKAGLSQTAPGKPGVAPGLTPKMAGVLAAASGGAKVKPDLNDPQTLAKLAGHVGVPLTTSAETANQKTTTIAQVASQIYSLPKNEIAGLQAQLWEAGLYDGNVEDVGGAPGPLAAKISPGNLDPYTMRAFGKLLSLAAGDKSANLSWNDYLTKAADNQQQGLSTGDTPSSSSISIQSLMTGATTGSLKPSQVVTVNQATPDQLRATMRTNFESALGRMPTDAELAQFTSEYDQNQQANSKYLDPNAPAPTDFADTGVDLVPGIARPTAAAADFARTDTVEYGAHQIGNAGALLLAAMRPGGSAADPNVTNAG